MATNAALANVLRETQQPCVDTAHQARSACETLNTPSGRITKNTAMSTNTTAVENLSQPTASSGR